MFPAYIGIFVPDSICPLITFQHRLGVQIVPHILGGEDGDLLRRQRALKSIVWKDDCQVCRLIATKCYAARDEQPCAEVTLEQL